MKVGDICANNFLHVSLQESILNIAKLMRSQNVGSVVVIEGSDGQIRPSGLITDRDIVIEVVATKIDASTVTAGDILSGELVTVKDTVELLDALNHLRYFGVRRAAVVDNDGHLVGLFSIDDALPILSAQFSEIIQLMSNESDIETQQRGERL
nr:CBS domain-containing protein [uncultured Glaciecola sp.]